MEEDTREEERSSPTEGSTCTSTQVNSFEAQDVQINVLSDNSNENTESTYTSGETLTREGLEEENSNTTCRICRDETVSDEVIAPCYCTGTLGRVHVRCLEEWLSRSNKVACEICQYKFQLKRQPRPFREWLCKRRSRRERRYIMGDCTCFCVLTPLVATSTYMCGQGAWYYFRHNESWTAFGLLILSAFLWFVFVFWFVVTLTFHRRSWREWRDRNQLVKLVLSQRGFESKESEDSQDTTSESDRRDFGFETRDSRGSEANTNVQCQREPILYVRIGAEQPVAVSENDNSEFVEVPI